MDGFLDTPLRGSPLAVALIHSTADIDVYFPNREGRAGAHGLPCLWHPDQIQYVASCSFFRWNVCL